MHKQTKTKISRSEQAQLLEKWQGLVYRIANKYSSPEDSNFEDICSAAQLGLLKSLKTFDPSKKASVITYAYRMMHWEVFLFLKKEKKKAIPMEYLEDKSIIDKYDDSVIQLMDQPYQDILRYKFWYNYSLSNIASIMNMAPHKIYPLYKEALEKIKECLIEN